MEFIQAVQNGSLPDVEAMLKADESVAASEAHGVSALMWALYYRHDPVAHLIRSYLTKVSVFEAAALGEIETLEGLLAQDASLAQAVSSDGFTALGFAAFFGHLDAVRLLVSAGAEIDRIATGNIKASPLHSALANGFVEVARELIRSGADVNLSAEGGWTPLHYAADLGDADLATFLLDHGADPTLQMEDGQTAADLGRAVGHDNVAEVIDVQVG